MRNIKIPLQQRNLSKRLESLDKWDINQEDKHDIIRFLNDLAIGKVNKGKRVGESRRLKVLELIRISMEFFKKPSSQLELKDVEKFENCLVSNKIKTQDKKPYADNTKKDIRVVLKTYIKWKLGQVKALELVGWIDCRVPKTTPNFLAEEEIEKLYKNCKNSSERFLIAVLFDSGSRAEEFHNIRYEDIQMPKDKDTFVKLTLKEEYSKTNGRVISLYWKHSLEAVRDYLEERRKDGIKNNEPIFKNNYDNSRQILFRLGKKVLDKPIHYHLFRHSSATYYASKLNRQQLCIRYGWAFSSRMPDTYISRSGVENKEIDEKFAENEVEDLRKKLQLEQQNYAIKLDEIKKDMDNLKKGFEFRGQVEDVMYKIIKNLKVTDDDLMKELLKEMKNRL